MFCNKCGKELPDGTKFCSGCGSQLKTLEPTASPSFDAKTATTPPSYVDQPAPSTVEGSGRGIVVAISLVIALISMFLPWVEIGGLFGSTSYGLFSLGPFGVVLWLGGVLAAAVSLSSVILGKPRPHRLLLLCPAIIALIAMLITILGNGYWASQMNMVPYVPSYGQFLCLISSVIAFALYSKSGRTPLLKK